MRIKAFGFGLCAALLGFITPVAAQSKQISLLSLDSDAITQVARNQIGMNSSAVSDHGQAASAWAVNQIIEMALGYQIGEEPNSVPSIRKALKDGQGSIVSDRSEAIPGDIIIATQDTQIGICMNDGCTKVVLNKASRLAWVTDADFSGLVKEKSTIYRLVALRLLQF